MAFSVRDTASTSKGGGYACRFDSGFCSGGVGFRDLRRCARMGRFPVGVNAATGQPQQKAPQLLITPMRGDRPASLALGTDRFGSDIPVRV